MHSIRAGEGAIALLLLLLLAAAANNPGPRGHTSSIFVTSGTFVVPTTNDGMIWVDGCAPGGGGAGGQAAANAAGGSGGSGGECAMQCPLEVTPGSTLTYTIPTAPAAAAAGSAGNRASPTTLTISGLANGTTFRLLTGRGGLAGSGGVGGTGAASPISSTGIVTGSAGGAAGGAPSPNNYQTFFAPCLFDGLASAGGGSTSGVGGTSPQYSAWQNSGGLSPGSGNGAGSAGAGSWFGIGQVGTAAGVDCSASPVWTGYGGGGCGAGSNGAGGPGGPGFLRFRYIS